MATIWVTGARGFIGRNLSRYLAGKGQSVLGLGHGAWPSSETAKWGVSYWLNGDVNVSNLGQLLRHSGPPKWIYHLAGGSLVGASFKSPLEDFRRTVDTTASLLDWVRSEAPGAGLILMSSAAVYGPSRLEIIREETPPAPCSPYGFHKAMMEMLGRSYGQLFGLKIAVPRFFSVYGEGLEKQLVWEICAKLKANPSSLLLGGTGQEVRDWIHISDVIRLLWLTRKLCSSDCQVLNGGTGQGASVAEIAALICQVWGRPVSPEFDGQKREGDPDRLVADIEKARTLGFSPKIHWKKGIPSVVQWFKSGRKG